MKILVLPKVNDTILIRRASGDSSRFLLDQGDGEAHTLVSGSVIAKNGRSTTRWSYEEDDFNEIGTVFFHPSTSDESNVHPSGRNQHETTKARISEHTKRSKGKGKKYTPESSDLDDALHFDYHIQPEELLMRLEDRHAQNSESQRAIWPEAARPIRDEPHQERVRTSDRSQPECTNRAGPERERRKIYCSHWLHYGNCDFEQQGCKYLHVMPDIAILRKIGFRQIPDWWRRREFAKSRTQFAKMARCTGPPFYDKPSHQEAEDAERGRPSSNGPVDSESPSSNYNLIDLSPQMMAEPFTNITCTSRPVYTSHETELPARRSQEDSAHARPSFVPAAQPGAREAPASGTGFSQPCFVRRENGTREAWMPPRGRKSKRRGR